MTDSAYSLPASVDFFKQIDTHTTARDYLNKEQIYVQGEKADALFYIRKGNVKLTSRSESGKKAVVAILHQGDLFGEGCLAKGSVRLSTATSIETSNIARVPRLDVARMIRQNPAFAQLLISDLVLRIARIQGDYLEQIFCPSEERLARLLLRMSGFAGKKKEEPAPLKVSQVTLAEMVGTTRARVSYFMNRFRKLGLIDYNGSVQVHPALRTFLENGQVSDVIAELPARTDGDRMGARRF
jgi:CRP-like cAMP-binding protein